jgi:hypothetical protein
MIMGCIINSGTVLKLKIKSSLVVVSNLSVTQSLLLNFSKQRVKWGRENRTTSPAAYHRGVH